MCRQEDPGRYFDKQTWLSFFLSIWLVDSLVTYSDNALPRRGPLFTFFRQLEGKSLLFYFYYPRCSRPASFLNLQIDLPYLLWFWTSWPGSSNMVLLYILPYCQEILRLIIFFLLMSNPYFSSGFFLLDFKINSLKIIRH